MSLKGKCAVVTGGTKGIGFAIAKRLLQDSANVFICGRSRSGVRRALERLSEFGTVHGEICDVRSEDQVRLMLEHAESLLGGLDILVNNAGLGYFGKTVEQTSGDEFRETLETNLFGVFYACRTAVPMMRKRGSGYIINISSLAGQNAHPRMAAYNASKFALNGFSEALMQEVRGEAIKVSYICPGSVNTAFGDDTPDETKWWQIQPDDIAIAVSELLMMRSNVLTSKIEMRPSNPPGK
jgi:NAD(P)-dependent dehydrogenase (short-subunit alcohol dehydrogenase family)